MSGTAITTREAAGRLSVSPQRMRQLIATGDIRAVRHGRAWAVDPVSVDSYDRSRRPTAGRHLSPTMAWAALLSDFGSDISDDLAEKFDLHRTERARLENLAQRNAHEWRWLAKRRATTEHFDTRDAFLDRIEARDDVVRTGVSATRDHDVGLATHERHLDVYVSEQTAADLTESMRLQPTSAGNLTLRAVGDVAAADFIMQRKVMPRSVVAVDLLDDADDRTARAGEDLIEAILNGR